MKARELLKGELGTRGIMALLLAGIFCGSTLMMGCRNSGSDADSPALGLTALDDTAPRFAPPTMEELNDVLQMTAEQMPLMEDALSTWTATMKSRMQARREKRDGSRRGDRGSARGASDRQPVFLGFVEASADILEPEQFTALADFFVERRAAPKADCPANDRRGHKGMKGSGARKAWRDKTGEFHGQRFEGFAEELNLTEEQQAALREIRQEGREAMRGKRAEFGKENFEGCREKAEEFREQHRERMEGILEPEQLARMDELKKQRRAEMAEKRQARMEQRLSSRVDFLARILDLDDAEKQQVNDILNGAHEQLKAYNEKMRDGGMTREDPRSEAKQIKVQTNMAIMELLTAEQTQLFTALQKLMPEHKMRHGRRFGHRR